MTEDNQFKALARIFDDSPAIEYSDWHWLDSHFEHAPEEQKPFIRMAAWMLRAAKTDINDGYKAIKDLKQLRKQPYPEKSENRKRIARMERLNSLLSRIERADQTVAWINGAPSIATFNAVCSDLEVSTPMCRYAIGRILRLETDGSRNRFLESKFSDPLKVEK